MWLVRVFIKESAYIEMDYLKKKGYGIVKPTKTEHLYKCSQTGIETMDISVEGLVVEFE